MANDAQSLLTDGKCYECAGLSIAETMQIQLLSNIIAGGSMVPCVPPDPVSAFHVTTSTSTTLSFALAFPIPQPTAGSIIKWGTTLGGPYPNSKTFGLADPLQVSTADGLVVGTQYYFVAYSNNGNGCVSVASAEVAGALIHATVADWALRVVANGGAAPSVATKEAMSVFMGSMDSQAITAKLKVINVFAPDSLTAARTPLVVGTAGNDPWLNNNFVAGDLTVNGLIGDGATKWLNIGCTPSGLFGGTDSAHISVYESTTTVANVCACGSAVGGSTQPLELFTNSFGTGQIIFDCWQNSGNGRLVVNPGPTVAGFALGSRVSNVDMRAYFANSTNAWAQQGATVAGVAGNAAAITQAMAAFGQGAAAGPFFFSNRRMSFISIGTGLTSGEGQALFNAVQQLRVSFGGGSV
jgi:hypothetical protein